MISFTYIYAYSNYKLKSTGHNSSHCLISVLILKPPYILFLPVLLITILVYKLKLGYLLLGDVVLTMRAIIFKTMIKKFRWSCQTPNIYLLIL